MTKEKLLMGCADNLYATECKPLTRERWLNYLNSSRVKNQVEKVRRTADPEQQRKEKAKLPVATPQGWCCGAFKDELCVENGLVGIDLDVHSLDQLPDRVHFYHNTVKPLIENLGLIYVAESSRLGMHLWAQLRGLSKEEARLRIVQALGVEHLSDPAVKNPARKFYVGGRVYLDLVTPLLPADDAEAGALVEEARKKLAERQRADVTMLQCDTPAVPAEPKLQAPTSYRGVNYDAIVNRLMQNLYDGQTAEPGARHTQAIRMAYLLAPIVDYRPEWLAPLLPEYTPPLPRTEMDNIVRDACAQRRRPELSREMRTALADCRLELNVADGESEPLPVMPAVSVPLFREFCNIAPQGFAPAVFFALLPMTATLASRLKATYISECEEPIVFLVCWVAEQASGKSYLRLLENHVLKNLRLRDAKAQATLEQWREECSRLSAQKDRPAEPQVVIREVGAVSSISAIAKMMKRAQALGQALYTSTEEIDEIARQKQSFNEKGAWMRKAYDEGNFSQSYLMKDTFSGSVAVKHNFLLAGTADRVKAFFAGHAHDGLAGRFAYATLPTPTSSDVPTFKRFTAKQQRVVDEVVASLENEEGTIRLKKLNDLIHEWLHRKWQLSIESGSQAVEVLRKRSANIAWRAGIMLYICNNRRWNDQIGKLVEWAAEYVLQAQLRMLGSHFDRNTDDDTPRHAVKALYSMLPDEFTREQLIRLRLQTGGNSNVRMLLSRWRGSRMVEELRPGVFRKTPKC